MVFDGLIRHAHRFFRILPFLRAVNRASRYLLLGRAERLKKPQKERKPHGRRRILRRRARPARAERVDHLCREVHRHVRDHCLQDRLHQQADGVTLLERKRSFDRAKRDLHVLPQRHFFSCFFHFAVSFPSVYQQLWISKSSLYLPPCASSCACVPSSSTRPFSR